MYPKVWGGPKRFRSRKKKWFLLIFGMKIKNKKIKIKNKMSPHLPLLYHCFAQILPKSNFMVTKRRNFASMDLFKHDPAQKYRLWLKFHIMSAFTDVALRICFFILPLPTWFCGDQTYTVIMVFGTSRTCIRSEWPLRMILVHET